MIITPHTSFYSEESLVELQVKAAQEVVAVLSGKSPRNPVNPEVTRTPMKAMMLTAPGELVRDEVARPGPEQGQLLVRVTHSGICGTDYKIFNGAIPVKYPRIMGHEMAGEVVEAGCQRACAAATASSSIRSSTAGPAFIAGSARRISARTACWSDATGTAASPST